MRPVQTAPRILPFSSRRRVTREQRPLSDRFAVGPLRRIELHQVDHDELGALRARLLELILDSEQARKISRLRLVR